MAEQAGNSEGSAEVRAKLEQRLGQLTYEIATLQKKLRECQQESNEVGNKLEKLDG